MECCALYFTAPGEVELREEILPPPAPGQARVRVLLSAISPGTEMLVYHGQFPSKLALDENIAALAGDFSYPLKYGYATAGRVEAVASDDDLAWVGRLVFAFQPHASHFIAGLDALIPLPEDISPEDAVFLPNMETAVNFLMDGAPIIGERVAVFGQGIVGLLTTALLGRFPLAGLVTLDRHALRREASTALGAHLSLDPAAEDTPHRLRQQMPDGADLTYELSGVPAALDEAIDATGFAGRVVIGSWYGQKRATLELGGRFHRSRIRLLSSQVSSLAPELSARWSKTRRFSVAWDMIRLVRPSRLVTQRIACQSAPYAYRLLDASPHQTIQVLLTWAES